jgi:hypothetical protein
MWVYPVLYTKLALSFYQLLSQTSGGPQMFLCLHIYLSHVRQYTVIFNINNVSGIEVKVPKDLNHLHIVSERTLTTPDFRAAGCPFFNCTM